MVGPNVKNSPAKPSDFQSTLTLENLQDAWRTVRRTCNNKRNLYAFDLNDHANLYKILQELRAGTYCPDPYYPFMIFEPKPRLVMSQSIRDKVVNHYFAKQILMPTLEGELIDANCATRKNMGTSYAIKLVKHYFGQLSQREPYQEIYALKLDIRKYFYTIDHAVLLEKVQKHLHDPEALEILRRIVSETDQSYISQAVKANNARYGTDIPYYQQGKGLSIGAMTSQFLAIFYLSDLDHFITEALGCRYFARYMDDFLILSTDKSELRRIWRTLEAKLASEYLLTLNPKTEIFCCRRGFNFLGFRFRVTDNRLRVSMARKTRQRIRHRLATRAKTDYLDYRHSLSSYYGYWLAVDHRRAVAQRPDFHISTADLLRHYPNRPSETNLVLEGARLHPHGDVFTGFSADLLLTELSLPEYGCINLVRPVSRTSLC